MLKLRRRLRSSRPVRRPLLTWEVLHIPVAPCLSGWRDHIRRWVALHRACHFVFDRLFL